MIEKPSTKELLARSLIELAEHKPVDKVSVREVAANCGVTAATFYNHFDNKYDLMAWINNRDTDSATDLFGNGNDIVRTIELSIEALLRWRSFFENALKNTHGADSFHRKTQKHSFEYFRARVRDLHEVERFSDEIEFALEFYHNALSSALVKWLVSKKPISAHQLAVWCVQDMPDCLRPILVDLPDLSKDQAL